MASLLVTSVIFHGREITVRSPESRNYESTKLTAHLSGVSNHRSNTKSNKYCEEKEILKAYGS